MALLTQIRLYCITKNFKVISYLEKKLYFKLLSTAVQKSVRKSLISKHLKMQAS